ncbi:MAG: GNAT family N-acetyltransferase [Chloroflexota bacterium]|nr:GNAT family N-acetyltransferase [Chloroflexota bacterium]
MMKDESALEAGLASKYVFEADDGTRIWVRPERPDDAPLLVDLFEHLSDQSRFQRFSKVLDRPDRERVMVEADRLAERIPPEEYAWLAFADLPDQQAAPIAAARLAKVADDTAEVAVVVRDDLQLRGIGSRLLNYVLDQARIHGMNRLTATFRSDNRAVWRLLGYSPYHVTWEMHGTQVDVIIHVPPLSRENGPRVSTREASEQPPAP